MSRYSFQFVDGRLNRQLIQLLEQSRVTFSLGEDGAVQYSPKDEEFVENELIRTIRDQQFPKSWQIISCPRDWADRYRQYMQTHRVPFVEERIDGIPGFVLPRRYRPHSWKLEQDRPSRQRQTAAG
jgi:hypothetical protein